MKRNTRNEKIPKEEKSFEKEDPSRNGEAKSGGESEEEDIKENPEKAENQLSTMLNGFNVQEKGCFQDINLYKIFKGNKLPELWKLWEIVLTNQPLMLVSDLPSECRYLTNTK